MKILCLFNNPCAIELFDWIEGQGNTVVRYSGILNVDWCLEQKFDLAVSYTYRYIISKEIIEVLNNNVVNIHNSFLPWNRGADPNIWSIIDNTPRGVTLHYIDSELDKGFIISQRILNDVSLDATLKSSYDELDMAAKEMFKVVFKQYKYWAEMKKKPVGIGSYHSINDGKKYKELIDSYNITIKDFKLLVESNC